MLLKSNYTDFSFNPYIVNSYSKLALGFANNSINATSFRKNSIITHFNNDGSSFQYVAFYDPQGMIILGQKKNNESWFSLKTGLYGYTADAHNTISIMTDKIGYLHMAWSDHNGKLKYMRSQTPHSLIMRECKMIGSLEDKATYPEFYKLPSGNLIFLYRNGVSGNGNLVLNKYDSMSESWHRVHDNLISGEGVMSPYWQATIDYKGRLHISWVWRDTSDVASNHDISYAMSEDSTMKCFVNSSNMSLALPITAEQDVCICHIPTSSALINQTSMDTDEDNLPYILSYWRIDEIVQYNILKYNGSYWTVLDTHIRNTDFKLSSKGTQQLPCARPQLLVKGKKNAILIYLLFRDIEHSSHFSIGKLSINGDKICEKKVYDVTAESVGEWEPNYDTFLWKSRGELSVFLQKTHYTSDYSKNMFFDNILEEWTYVLDLNI